MYSTSRTKKHDEANRLDLDVYRIVALLYRFSDDFRDEDVREMAATLDAMRSRVRKHMHPVEREATERI